MNQLPKSLQLSESIENKEQRIETISIFPRSINDTNTAGGQCSFILPRRGAYLSADSRIVLPATCVEEGYQYPPNLGVFSLIQSASMRTESSGKFAEIDNANHLYANLNQLTEPEKKLNIDSQLHGINFVFETCSGSKLDSNPDNSEVLAGQYRLAGDVYEKENPSQDVKGRNNCRPNWVNADYNFNLETDYENTPQYSISLGDLFPGLFKVDRQFPLGLLNEEVILDIVFSQNGDWGSNDRAIFCPSQSLATHDSITSLVWITQGQVHTSLYNQTDLIMDNQVTGSGTGLRLMYDSDATGKMINVRILDGGKGYKETDMIKFQDPAPLNYQVDPKFMISTAVDPSIDDDESVFNIVEGSGYEDGETYNVSYSENQTFLLNESNSFKVIYNEAEDTNDENWFEIVDPENVTRPYGTVKVETPSGGTQAQILIARKVVNVTTSSPAGAFAVGDSFCLSTDQETAIGTILEKDANNMPTKLLILGPQELVATNKIEKSGDDTKNCVLDTVEDHVVYATEAGLGLDPVFNYNDTPGKKINIVTDQVFIATDLIYYLDGRLERDQDKMMKEGFQQVYTQFKSMKTTISEFSNDVSGYGSKSTQQFSRLMGLSNEVLRNILFRLYPSGPQDVAKFPYHNVTGGKQNPLLLNYCSRASRAQDGMRFNVNVNSIPYYSSQIQTDLRMYHELNKCFGKPFYINKGHYMASPDCRQDNWTDNLTEDNPSKQPGFTTLDSAIVVTKQYEENDRKAGVSNQGYMGISQTHLRGTGHLMGCSFKKQVDAEQVAGNGVAVGSQAVDLQFEYDATYDPRFDGQSTLMCFAECERVLLIKQGSIINTTSSI